MKTQRSRPVLAGSFLLAGTLVCVAADWPAYHGLNGDGISSESVASPWPADGPKRLWTVETAGGFSSFTVAGGKAFTVVARAEGGAPAEMCLALDAATGKELWAVPTGPAQYPGGGGSQVVLVEASPAAYKEVARFKAVEGKCWSTPALANGWLYVRSTKQGDCFDLAAPAAR